MASIATNAFVLCFQANVFQDWNISNADQASRSEGFIVVQYVLVAVVIAAFLLIPATPDRVYKNLCKQEICQQKFARAKEAPNRLQRKMTCSMKNE